MSFNLAILGANGYLGEAFIELLAESALQPEALFPLSGGGNEGARIPFRGSHYKTTSAADFDFSQVNVTVICSDDSEAASVASRAMEAGGWVIDIANPRGLEGVDGELYVAGISGMPGQYGSRYLYSPDAAAIHLARLLDGFQERYGLLESSVVICQSVSAFGQAGVESLASETANLLNAKAPKPSVFSQQLAFNLIPLSGSIREEDGASTSEWHTREACLQLLARPEMPMQVTTLQLPLFFGFGYVVQVRCEDYLDTYSVVDMLAEQPGMVVVGDSEPQPTPVTQATHSQQISISRIRPLNGGLNGMEFWAVADNVRAGGAWNGVSTIEILVNQFL